jgi:maltose O-acetyltransferase
MLRWVWDLGSYFKKRWDRARLENRWRNLRKLGMHIGENVFLPESTWIDTSHCYLISIGDWCGFGNGCLILAHDAQMDEFLDAGKIAKVVIHESCHIGARTLILPGVEIGPRTIVGAGSVVWKSLPPDTVCAGAPARPILSLEQYLRWYKARLAVRPKFPYLDYNIDSLTPQKLAEIQGAVADGEAYIVGGHSEELKGKGGTPRTNAQ